MSLEQQLNAVKPSQFKAYCFELLGKKYYYFFINCIKNADYKLYDINSAACPVQ